MIVITDKELGITVAAAIEEAISDVRSLIEIINEIPDTITASVEVSGVEELSDSAEQAGINLQEINEAASFANSGISDIDPSSIEEVTTTTEEADIALQALQEAAAHAGTDIANIDPSALKETAESAEQASGSMEGMVGVAGLVEGAFAAIVGVGIAEFFDQIANSAGNLGDSWLRLSVAIGGTAKDVDAMQATYGAAINSMKENTGRSAGTIREHIINMGLAGVTSQDQIVSSFSAISGAAFEGKVSLATMENTFSRVVMQPKRLSMALRTMKITTADVMGATNMSVEELQKKFETLSPTARAAMLETIINFKYGQRAVDAYKVSWEHLKDAAGAAFEGLTQAVGKLVLPILIPAMEFMTNAVTMVADAINALPGPVKSVFGALLSLAGIFATLKYVLAPLLSLIGIDMGVALTSFVGLLTGSAEATGALAVVLGPVGWAIAAIIGVIAGGIFVWTTWKDEVIALKDALMSGDWGAAAGMIADAFSYLGGSIWNALQYAGQVIYNWFAGLPAWIGKNETKFLEMGRNFVEWIIKGLLSMSNYLSTILTDLLAPKGGDSGAQTGGEQAGQQAGQGLIDGLMQWLEDNGPLIAQLLADVFLKAIPLLIMVLGQVGAIIVVTLWQKANEAGQGFLNSLTSWFAQLPGRIWSYLMQTLSNVAYFTGFMIGYGVRLGLQFVASVINGIISLPGRVWGILLQTLGWIQSFAGQAPGLARSAGSRIVSGLIGAITGLPGLVWGILMNVANKLMSIGGTLYNRARNLGAQIWNGFKAGLGIQSPSYLERAMDNIIAKSHEMPVEMLKDAEALARINWQNGAPDFTATYNTNDRLEVTHKVDLINVPPGNSDESIADLVADIVTERKVIDKISVGLGRGVNRSRRTYGV